MRIQDIAEITMGQSPPGEACNRTGDGLPLLNGPTEFGSHHPTPAQWTTAPARLADAGDLLFCVRGSTTGRMNWADQDYAIGRGVAALRHRSGTEYQPYLRAAIEYQLAHLLAAATGSTFPNVSRSQIAAVEVPDMGLPEQRAIAEVLGALDDKIELNERMNATLDEMARALFKSWFVDFDPVRAKAEDRQPSHMDPATAALFPDSFEESELGPIPAGWRAERLGDHIEIVRGLSYKGKFLTDDGLPLHNLNSIYEGGGYKYEGIKFYSGDYQERHLVNAGDLIVANTEQGHDRLLIGYAALVPSAFDGTGLFSHHLYRVRPSGHSPLSTRFMYLLLCHPRAHDAVSGFANGTTVNMLPSDGVTSLLTPISPREVVAAFDDIVAPMMELAETHHYENSTLAELRDTLLPKLISGEILVGEAASTVEAAV